MVRTGVPVTAVLHRLVRSARYRHRRARSAGGQPWRNPERRGDGRGGRRRDAEPGTAQRHGGAGNPDVGGSALAARRESAPARLTQHRDCAPDHEMSRYRDLYAVSMRAARASRGPSPSPARRGDGRVPLRRACRRSDRGRSLSAESSCARQRLFGHRGGLLVADRGVQRCDDRGEDSASRRSQSSSATGPSMQRSANNRETLASNVNDSSRLRAIIGMYTLSSKAPDRPPTVISVEDVHVLLVKNGLLDGDARSSHRPLGKCAPVMSSPLRMLQCSSVYAHIVNLELLKCTRIWRSVKSMV